MSLLRYGLLIGLLVCLAAAAPLPPYDGGSAYVIPPGTYELDQNITFVLNSASNLTIEGDCPDVDVGCVFITVWNETSFVFVSNSSNLPRSVTISGIHFVENLGSKPTLLFETVADAVIMSNLAILNHDAPFIAVSAVRTLELSNIQIQDCAGDSIFFLEDPTNTNYVELISLDRLNVVENSADTVFLFGQFSMAYVSITRSNFTQNFNVFKVPELTGFAGFGMVDLLIDDIYVTSRTESLLPFLDHFSTSVGVWTIQNSLFEDNPGWIIQSGGTATLLVQDNTFTRCTGGLISVSIQSSADFIGNQYSQARHKILLSRTEITNNPNFTMTNESFDFGNSIGVSTVALGLTHFSSAALENVTFSNINSKPGDASGPSVVSFEATPTISFKEVTFENIALTDTVPVASKLLVILTSEVNISLTMSNVSFGPIDPTAVTLSDIAVSKPNTGRVGSLNIYSTSLLSLDRVVFRENARIDFYGPVAIQDKLSTSSASGLSAVTFHNLLEVAHPLKIVGRLSAISSGLTNFKLTPALNGSITVVGDSAFTPYFDASSGTFGVDLGTGIDVISETMFDLISSYTSNPRVYYPTRPVVAAWDGNTAKPGFAATLIDSNDNSTKISIQAVCSLPCIKGVCSKREVCECSTGWSGASCSCKEEGRPVGAACSTGAEIEWIFGAPQTLPPGSTFDVPEELTVVVNADYQVGGTLNLGPGAKLVVDGKLDLSSGALSSQPSTQRYSGSCEIYLPTTIVCQELTMAAGTNPQIKAVAAEGECTGAKRDFVGDSYDTMIVVNGTATLSGTITVDTTSIGVAPGTQQQLRIVGSSEPLVISGLTVTANTQSGTCSKDSQQTGLISLFLTNCFKGNGGIKWWWWGAPVIAAAGVVIIVVVLVLTIPGIRRRVLPYSAKAN